MEKEKVKGLLLEDLWDLCYRAHSNVSFSPEKRATMYVTDYSAILKEDLEELGDNPGNYKEKFISKFSDWMSAKGRCISSMITGPSNFPVQRAEKANRSEHNKSNHFHEWREKYFKAVNRKPTLSPEEELDSALNDLEVLVRKQELMKIVNSLIRRNHKKVNKSGLEQILLNNDIPMDYINEAMDESYVGLGFARFQLTNNNAKIKARKDKVTMMRVRIDRKNSWEDVLFDGGRVTLEDDRIKIYHDSKPEQEIINELKSSGFRWSPHWGCWCRKHTGNAIWITKRLSFIKERNKDGKNIVKENEAPRESIETS